MNGPASSRVSASAATDVNSGACADARFPDPVMRGRLLEKSDDHVVVGVPETSYRLHLVLPEPIDVEVGRRVRGVIHCQARRVDVVPSGGRFIEPVFGRPRRIQGWVTGGDVQRNVLHVKAEVPLVVHLMPSQQASEFETGQMVCFDAEAGAKFVPRR